MRLVELFTRKDFTRQREREKEKEREGKVAALADKATCIVELFQRNSTSLLL